MGVEDIEFKNEDIATAITGLTDDSRFDIFGELRLKNGYTPEVMNALSKLAATIGASMLPSDYGTSMKLVKLKNTADMREAALHDLRYNYRYREVRDERAGEQAIYLG